VLIWSNIGAAQGRLGTRKRNRSNDLDLICVHLERTRSIQLSYGRTTCVDSKSFIAGDDTILAASSLCRKGRRSMQLSYAPILGYSFDSTKVAKPIRQPIRRESWSNWNGRNEETDGRNDDPPKKSGGPNKGSQGQRLRTLA